MKKWNKLVWVAMIILMALPSCDKYEQEEQEGSLQLSLVLDIEEKIMTNSDPEIKAMTKAVDVSDFLIRIYNEDRDLSAEYSYSSMPEIITLKTGTYTIEAHSDELKMTEARWNSPYYFGEESFTISRNEVTRIGTITCEMKNIKVEINCDDNFYEAINDDMKVMIELEGVQLEFTKYLFSNRSGKIAYFPAQNDGNILTINLEGRIDGQKVTLGKSYPVDRGAYIRLTYEYKSNGSGNVVGNGSLSLIVVDSEKVEQDVSVPAEEKVLEDI